MRHGGFGFDLNTDILGETSKKKTAAPEFYDTSIKPEKKEDGKSLRDMLREKREKNEEEIKG